MNFNSVCRTCLSTEFLNPIFVKSVDHKRYSTAIFVTTGLKVDINDGLPQQMCAHCVHFLNSSLKFRKQCKDAETTLLQFKSECNSLADTSEIRPEAAEVEEVKETKEVEDKDCEIDDDGIPKTEAEVCEDNGQGSKETPVKKRTRRKRVPLDSTVTRVTCTLCQKDLSVRSLDSHMAKTHPGADESRVKCELCDSYVTRQKMNRHLNMMHGSMPFRCGYCKTEYDSKEELVEHVGSCTAKKKKRKVSEKSRALTQCPWCRKSMQRASLRSHVATAHKGLRPVCEHCGRKFGNRLRLAEHLRAKHGHEKLRCQYCEFTSASNAALRNHERRHRGEKPYVCEQCGAGFHAAYLLAQHRHSHRTEKKLKCGQCCAVFKAGNSLHAHRRAVHGRARHRCPLCARHYACRHYAVKHMRAVHRYTGPIPPLQIVPDPSEM